MKSNNSWIGLDESGKGDYFGPLVVAGVYVTAATADRLAEIGIRDSKRIADSRILKLDQDIRSITKFSIVAIGPKRYNELYGKIRNLNRLLAWGHARTLENLLKEVNCPRALADQFGDEKLIKRALMEKGRSIILEQRHRAEEDIAVAAASILARAEFLKRLRRLSEECGVGLPKGSSHGIQEAARRIITKYESINKGKEALGKVAKWHFKITKQVVGA